MVIVGLEKGKIFICNLHNYEKYLYTHLLSDIKYIFDDKKYVYISDGSVIAIYQLNKII